MTVRELIETLSNYPADAQAYVGKGIGPVRSVRNRITDGVYVLNEIVNGWSSR